MEFSPGVSLFQASFPATEIILRKLKQFNLSFRNHPRLQPLLPILGDLSSNQAAECLRSRLFKGAWNRGDRKHRYWQSTCTNISITLCWTQNKEGLGCVLFLPGILPLWGGTGWRKKSTSKLENVLSKIGCLGVLRLDFRCAELHAQAGRAAEFCKLNP